ncbi:Peptidyl-prolyl cis-trans isomerase [Pediococcus damnosus]|uniref:Peptidyl-prolyl cis-trans isomerase n=1 Tax=Pediococcus damnosus TaxID=51663 RepID=A0A0R2HLW4_9LACO|nr:peptidylprolyl isomerase [Pediococcus damnosus]AMV61076.1 Peptidyl-prolyl cis-trans isomerase [Pediococcus damnosus]AMV63639.1 Peptidyl-prolyl cis-trans isomerase [Pediococcus damnosus]AMV65436.1 Peptidyl-prolyl cis-trans isomerase [Pediococcus damnosus]AMV66420.1 Peptidyl-prolyl cis-trans isomerase [Pediococcus damnosus]AMV68722.1 Peptidyl-prolyl cis-trans isomerase [Pediococcus damnosus]
MTYPQLDLENVAGPKATIQTNLGDIKIQLFPAQAPKAVENFVALANQGYYDGIIFHRVIPDFMIQGGDPTGTGAGGQSSFGKEFEDEFSNEVFNLKGALSMANAGPNTNGSQFFIVSNENVQADMLADMKQAGYPSEIIEAYKQGGTPWLDHHHTVFGQTISGLDVVEKISNAARDYQDKPNEDITIKTVVIEDAQK